MKPLKSVNGADGIADEKLRHFGKDRHRHEILLGVVRELRIERGIDRVIGRGDQQRVAVLVGLGDGIGRKNAAGARLRLEHDGASEFGGHAVGDEPRHDVDRAAGRERQDELDRPVGILRQRRRCARHKRKPGNSSRENTYPNLTISISPFAPSDVVSLGSAYSILLSGQIFMNDAVKTTCCIVGGGPAGMMLGFLLARAGISVGAYETAPKQPCWKNTRTSCATSAVTRFTRRRWS